MFIVFDSINNFFLTIHGILHDCAKAWTMTTKVDNLKSLKYQRLSWKFQIQRGISAFYRKIIYFDIKKILQHKSQRVFTRFN